MDTIQSVDANRKILSVKLISLIRMIKKASSSVLKMLFPWGAKPTSDKDST